MSRPPLRAASAVPFCFAALLVCGIFSPVIARAQFSSSGPITVHSVSGQFIVVAGPQFSPLLHNDEFATNADYIRLDPALLAVSAERFKASVWGQLGLKPDSPWSGKIFLALHPANSPDDTAGLTVGAFLNAWSCRVELPDLVTLPRYGRALTAALLLEIAGRKQTDPSRVPEIPAWLADGLAQIAYSTDADRIVLSLPSKTVNGLSQTRMDKHERGVDASQSARHILQNSPALTFDELCWPNDQQINGEDGRVYLASAQMFTTELLALPDGPAKMQNFLALLPSYFNWQTAFFAAFQADFKNALSLEKWWSLRVVRFATRDPGPHWTMDVSRDRLAALLTVPVEYRASSNSLPEHMQISLQSAVQNFTPEQREEVLQTKLRDLRVAELRLLQPFGGLAGGYANVLGDFLGEGRAPVLTPANKHVERVRRTASMAVTIRKLDELDAQRRDAEAKVPADVTPDNLNQTLQ